jgi:hypothetical protein
MVHGCREAERFVSTAGAYTVDLDWATNVDAHRIVAGLHVDPDYFWKLLQSLREIA